MRTHRSLHVLVLLLFPLLSFAQDVIIGPNPVRPRYSGQVGMFRDSAGYLNLISKLGPPQRLKLDSADVAGWAAKFTAERALQTTLRTAERNASNSLYRGANNPFPASQVPGLSDMLSTYATNSRVDQILSGGDASTTAYTKTVSDDRYPLKSTNQAALDVRTARMSLAQLSASNPASPPAYIYYADPIRQGTFVLDASDTTTPSDSAMCLTDGGGRRYKRADADVLFARYFGVVGDGTVNDSPALQRAANYSRITGKRVYVPGGRYRLEQPVSFSLANSTGSLLSGGRRGGLYGVGSASTVFYYVGPASSPALSFLGTYDEQFEPTGFSVVRGDQSQQGIGIYADRMVNHGFSNIKVAFFDTGIKLVNINEGSFVNITCEWNKQGLYATTNGEILPNANTFTACHFNSNSNYGAFIEAGSGNKFETCTFLGNGSASAGAALMVSYGKYNGATALTVDNCYMENNGKYTISVTASDGGSFVFRNNTWNKTVNPAANGAVYATNHVRFTPVNLVKNDGKIINILLSGNSTFTPSPYVASASRPDIVLDPGPNGFDGYTVNDENYYDSQTEAATLPCQISRGFDGNGLMDLKGYSPCLVYIENSSGTLKRITGGPKVGETIVLQSDNAITIQHTANLLLKNSANATLGSGNTIMLMRIDANTYRQVGY